jgi:hypothetical protein
LSVGLGGDSVGGKVAVGIGVIVVRRMEVGLPEKCLLSGVGDDS